MHRSQARPHPSKNRREASILGKQSRSFPGPSVGNRPQTSNTSGGRKVLQHSSVLSNTTSTQRKRKRSQESEDQLPQIPEGPTQKRLRTLPASCAVADTSTPKVEYDINKGTHPINHWIQEGHWPQEYFEQDSQVRDDFEQDSWLEEQMESSTEVVQYVEINGRRYPRPIRKVPTSLRRKQSDSSLTGSTDQKKRENKSAAYRDTRYTTLLEAKGSYLREFDDDNIPKNIMDLSQKLLENDQTVPLDSLFRNDIFKKTCRKVEDRNEARVIQDISRLIVPSAETLATYGATNLNHLIEGVNEGWTASIAVQGPRPQPDYSVGFRRSAFTDKELNKLNPLIGSVYDTSFFVATYRMYFPFLTCEVKCGAAALDVADRQNAHSMTVAVRGIVELYRAVKRETELDQEILAFSVSHDHSAVRIYGHYALIEKDKTTFYRHPIHKFDFTAQDGKDKWTAYRFTKNVYDIWMPIHLKRICSVINELPPDINFELSQSASFPQELDLESFQQSNAGSLPEGEDSQSSLIGSQDVTPNTSFSQRTGRQFKKPKNNPASGQQR